MQEKLPDLCENGKVYYITSDFPPVVGGSSVINRNLLSRFNPKSFVVFASDAKQKNSVALLDPDTQIHRVFKTYYFSKKVNVLMNRITLRSTIRKVLKQARIDSPKVIIASYPNYYALKIAREVSKELNIPLIPYIHDTIAESRVNNVLEKEASILQEQVFKEAAALLVMSEGIRELYSKKYNIDSISLEHTYLEEIPSTPESDSIPLQAFWGGYIYSINSNSVRRLLNSLNKLNINTFLASSNTMESLENAGIITEKIKTGFFSDRSDYLENLKKHGILLLAIDWDDESRVHKDELATIFPTKTPEYLASGNLIIVHCPENYFLAKFFRDNNCGIVISDRSEDIIVDTIKKVLDGSINCLDLRNNALKAAHKFNSDVLSRKFKKIVDEVYKKEVKN